jgi:hypothetical protein
VITAKHPWVYIGTSENKPLYFNEQTGECALEDVQEGRLFTPKEPVILEEITTAAAVGPVIEGLIASWGG